MLLADSGRHCWRDDGHIGGHERFCVTPTIGHVVHGCVASASEPATMGGGASEAFKRDHPWFVRQMAGRRWQIIARTDAADLLMQEVGTPGTFPTKGEAEGWLRYSLMDHLPAPNAS
jgi:hypothetical protein